VIDAVVWLGALRRATAAATAVGTTLAAAARAVVDEVCAASGWPVGRLLLVSNGEVVPTAVWGLADPDRFRSLADVAGAATVAVTDLTAEGVAPQWSSDLVAAAVATGLRSAVTFPVVDGSGTVALVEFLSEQVDRPDEAVLDMAWAAVGQLGGVADRLSAAAAEVERKRLEGQLASQALHDRLTGLPNRVLLRDRVEHAMARSGREGSSVALLVADVDRFKVVNESVGHEGGDRLLVAVGERLADILRPGDTVARMGGDEFALLCEEVASSDEAAGIAARVLEAFEKPFRVKGADMSVTASVGVAVGGRDVVDAELLLRNADVAMYRAKDRGRDRLEVFDESMLAHGGERLSVENDLRRAISQGQLRLYYQPIVHIETGVIAGFEALVRWQHPVRGLLPPIEFIPAAEETGLIVPLGRHVLQEACRQAATWQASHPAEALRVSVNVSARQLAQPGWSDEVAQILAESCLEPRQLVLEITESVLMADTDASALRLEELRRLGVRIAIDDFGTGYSSLVYLRRLPVDVLKIDKSFIDGVAEGPHESALARAVVKLASTLRLEAVAEGITTRKQLSQLRRLHCPYGQGYFFSRPQPTAALPGLLALPALEGVDPGE